MITIETIPNECRTEHLFLLIGANPLPNYVAALLLRTADTTFHLLHTQQTLTIAENLRDRILNQYPEHKFELKQVDATDGEAIRSVVEALLNNIPPRASVGLNYTGGTKAMSVHAYRAVEQKRPDAIFTYLDAQTLSLRIDGRSGEPVRGVPVNKFCDVALETLMRLHGYQRFQGGILPNLDQQNRLELVKTIAALTIDLASYGQWKAYTLQKPLERLPDLKQWPLLSPFVESVQSICGASEDTSKLSKFLGLGEKSSACRSWLQGGWLEEYTLDAINSVKKTCQLNDLGINLKPVMQKNDNSFELDLATMRGYQLFALSCMVTDDKDFCQEHFFEAYIRARQLGGEEAHAALVCFLPISKLTQLEQKTAENWLTQGHTRVFGREHLANLAMHLSDWIHKASSQI